MERKAAFILSFPKVTDLTWAFQPFWKPKL